MRATIEPEPELELVFIRPPDDPSTVHEYQKGIMEFAASLDSLGIKASTRSRARLMPYPQLGRGCLFRNRFANWSFDADHQNRHHRA
jgi:hypothetical protein